MRALILVAGMGTRLRPLTLKTPKSLILVNGKPILERQIEALKEKGIDEIIVVTGYLHEQFDYLADKYKVKLVHNDKYDVYNNVYTMYLVRQYLEDTYVLDGDVYFNRNFIVNNPSTSLYFCSIKNDFKNEWVPILDREKNVTRIEVKDGNNEYIHSGVSYWTKEDGQRIVKKLEEVILSGDFKNLYWDNIMKDIVQSLHLKIQPIRSDDSYEIDNLEELRALQELLSKTRSVVPQSLFKQKTLIDKEDYLASHALQKQLEQNAKRLHA